MRNTIAVFKNQFNEFISDKEQLMLYILFPGLAFFQVRMTDLDYGVYPYQIVSVVGSMMAGAIMIMALPALIAEHRENGSLRFMVMSGIKPTSYLLGVGGFFIVLNMLVAVFLAWLGEFNGTSLINFMLTMFLGFICSMLTAAIIGILSKNRQKALGIAMPVGFALAFLPMFAESLEAIQPIMNLLYVGRLSSMMESVSTGSFMTDLYVILANIAVLTMIFVGLFKIKGMKS